MSDLTYKMEQGQSLPLHQLDLPDLHDSRASSDRYDPDNGVSDPGMTSLSIQARLNMAAAAGALDMMRRQQQLLEQQHAEQQQLERQLEQQNQLEEQLKQELQDSPTHDDVMPHSMRLVHSPDTPRLPATHATSNGTGTIRHGDTQSTTPPNLTGTAHSTTTQHPTGTAHSMTTQHPPGTDDHSSTLSSEGSSPSHSPPGSSGPSVGMSPAVGQGTPTSSRQTGAFGAHLAVPALASMMGALPQYQDPGAVAMAAAAAAAAMGGSTPPGHTSLAQASAHTTPPGHPAFFPAPDPGMSPLFPAWAAGKNTTHSLTIIPANTKHL